MGKQWKTVADFIFLGSKITADGDCSYEIKRHLLLEREVMTNLDSILENRDVTLPTKACLVKAVVFPVVMYGCESWTITTAVQFSSVAQSCLTLCDPRDCSMPGLPVHHQLPESWLQSPSAVILEPPNIKVCHCFHCFPIYLP